MQDAIAGKESPIKMSIEIMGKEIRETAELIQSLKSRLEFVSFSVPTGPLVNPKETGCNNSSMEMLINDKTDLIRENNVSLRDIIESLRL